MRIEAGPHRVTTSQGLELHVDHPISMGQADVLYRVLDESGLDPDEVFAIELNECGVFAELVDLEGHDIDSPEPAPKRVALIPPGGRGVAISTILPDR
jgi:hypothetical protein